RLWGLFGRHGGMTGVQRELNQIEGYQANIRAIALYERRPLKGRLRALEIFESTRPRRSREREPVDWGGLWGGDIPRYRRPGKDSGDALRGENARIIATLLAERLKAARNA